MSKLLHLIIFSILLIPNFAYADFILDHNSNRIFGRVTDINHDFIRLDVGCTGQTYRYRWERFDKVVLNSTCTTGKEAEIGGDTCNDAQGNEVDWVNKDDTWTFVYARVDDTGTYFDVFDVDKIISFDGDLIAFRTILDQKVNSHEAKYFGLSKTNAYCPVERR